MADMSLCLIEVISDLRGSFAYMLQFLMDTIMVTLITALSTDLLCVTISYSMEKPVGSHSGINSRFVYTQCIHMADITMTQTFSCGF